MLGVYGSVFIINEEVYLLGKFVWVVLKIKYIDYNGCLCMLVVVFVVSKIFGMDWGFMNSL